MKFSIVTPTIGRSTLSETLRSVAEEGFKDYEHVVCFDGAYGFAGFIKSISYLPIDITCKIMNTGKNFNDFGHSVRQFAWRDCEGDYIGYLDDDDVYINGTLHKVAKAIEEHPDAEFIIFPCLRMGQKFFSNPARLGLITSVQYFHKRIGNDGQPIRFTPGGYGHDGDWVIEQLKTHSAFYLDCEPLVQVDRISSGAML